MPLDSTEFRRVLGHFPTGVTVVTAMTDNGPLGMTIGSFASVSLEPPLVMFCPAKASSTWAQMSTSSSFCVNVLSEDQSEICRVFANDAKDRFANIQWRSDATGSPVIADSVAFVDCQLHAVYDGGDHDIVVGLVKALSVERSSGPLLFLRGIYGRFEKI